ncbi:hypothetical protein K1719_042255 [Acacia pycnantha]|nr:hypothetical protein K1719_042255 [Acacia pycnantha]
METEQGIEGSKPTPEAMEAGKCWRRRIGDGDAAFTRKVSNPPRLEDWMRDSKEDQTPITNEGKEEGSKLRSYKDSLMDKSNWGDNWFATRDEDNEVTMAGVGSGSVSSVGFEDVLDFNSGISIDLFDPLCPKFMIDDKERERLCKPFAKSLLVKLLGGSLSLYFLEYKLNQIWARKGAINLGDLENDFFVVSLQEWEDYERALTGGPWVISDKYLSIMRWRPGFNLRKEKNDKIVAWVCFPEIEAELFYKKIMYNLANSIGKVLKLDVHTANRGRNKFARVCIKLDLTKPLVPQYMVDGVLKQVEYKSLHALCLNCGLFGHFKESCVHGKKDPNEVEKVVLEGPDGIEKGEIAENSKQASGPWKVVQRLRRQRKDRPRNEEIKIASRYDVLNTREEPWQGDISTGRGAAME